MTTWFLALNAFEKIFLLCAMVGGILFFVRLVLMFIGGDAHAGDGDVPGDLDGGDVGGHDGDAHHAGDTDVAFKLLSFQGITAFFMMFGLVGLAMSKASGLHWGLALAGAVVAGLLTVWITDRLFRSFGRLQHSGTLQMKNAVGQEGTVYLTIRPSEKGQVQVTVQGRLLTLDAVSKDEGEIATGTRVKVVELSGDSTLVVQKI